MTFYPWHVIKDTLMMAAVFAALLTAAMLLPAHLDEIANPADANYVPRPEWYFLPLFQLLKYVPGPLEIVATQIVPGLAVAALFALPFLDRGGARHPWAPARRRFTAAFAVAGRRRRRAHLARAARRPGPLRSESLGAAGAGRLPAD